MPSNMSIRSHWLCAWRHVICTLGSSCFIARQTFGHSGGGMLCKRELASFLPLQMGASVLGGWSTFSQKVGNTDSGSVVLPAAAAAAATASPGALLELQVLMLQPSWARDPGGGARGAVFTSCQVILMQLKIEEHRSRPPARPRIMPSFHAFSILREK